MAKKLTRRQAIATASSAAMASMINIDSFGILNTSAGKLALQGGTPVRTAPWPTWPVWDPAAEQGILEMLRTGRWWRGNGEHVVEFENRYAELMGAKRCLATSSGTSALLVSLQAAGVDAGDEVLVSPYTFIASYNVIFISKALPVFVDSDPETFLLDPKKIEERITDRTTAIIPVHIYGLPCDMDSVNTVSKKHGLKVIEDACQAWLGEYKGKKLGTLGDAGCFSFQNSKNLPAGEGGAIVSNNGELMDLCHSIHNCGRPYGTVPRTSSIPINGGNNRMQQIQALILMTQMNRIQKDADQRLANAKYLDAELSKIPGIVPAKLVPGGTRSAYHLYAFRYDKEKFNNLPKDKFLQALRAEGIPGNSGYGQQNKEGIIEHVLTSRGYKRLYSEARLKQWREQNVLPGNDKLCSEAVTFTQNILLGSRSDMGDIVKAIAKISENKAILG
jgi:perosamine synthetase